MKTLESRLEQIKAQIKHAAEEHERSADSVQLLAVSKKQPADQLRAAYALGQSAKKTVSAPFLFQAQVS